MQLIISVITIVAVSTLCEAFVQHFAKTSSSSLMRRNAVTNAPITEKASETSKSDQLIQKAKDILYNNS
jgi:hypothetical protein